MLLSSRLFERIKVASRKPTQHFLLGSFSSQIFAFNSLPVFILCPTLISVSAAVCCFCKRNHQCCDRLSTSRSSGAFETVTISFTSDAKGFDFRSIISTWSVVTTAIKSIKTHHVILKDGGARELWSDRWMSDG